LHVALRVTEAPALAAVKEAAGVRIEVEAIEALLSSPPTRLTPPCHRFVKPPSVGN